MHAIFALGLGFQVYNPGYYMPVVGGSCYRYACSVAEGCGLDSWLTGAYYRMRFTDSWLL